MQLRAPLHPIHEHQPGPITPSPLHPTSNPVNYLLSPFPTPSCILAPLPGTTDLSPITFLHSPNYPHGTPIHGLSGPRSIGLAQSGAAIQTPGFPGAPLNLWKGPGPRLQVRGQSGQYSER